MNKSTRRVVWLLFSPLAVATLAAPARADTLTLVDGRVIRRVVAHREGGRVTVESPLGSTTYPADQVAAIEVGEDGAAAVTSSVVAARSAPAPAAAAPGAPVAADGRGLTPEGAALREAHARAVERAKEKLVALEKRVLELDAAHEARQLVQAARERARDSYAIDAMPAYPDTWIVGGGRSCWQPYGIAGFYPAADGILVLAGARHLGHDRPGHERPGHDRPGHERPGFGRDRWPPAGVSTPRANAAWASRPAHTSPIVRATRPRN